MADTHITMETTAETDTTPGPASAPVASRAKTLGLKLALLVAVIIAALLTAQFALPRLFAMFGPLQRPADRQQTGFAGQPPGQLANAFGLDITTFSRPGSVFRLAVGLPQQILGKVLKTDAISLQKCLVM